MGWGAMVLQNGGLVMGPWPGPQLWEGLLCAEGKQGVPLALVVALSCAQQCH